MKDYTDKVYDSEFGRKGLKEYILCAAIWFKDGKEHPHQPRNIKSGFVICGRRHHNIFVIASMIDKDLHKDSSQGFLTSEDRFLDRYEAAELAMSRKQIGKETNLLFSEDLY